MARKNAAIQLPLQLFDGQLKGPIVELCHRLTPWRGQDNGVRVVGVAGESVDVVGRVGFIRKRDMKSSIGPNTPFLGVIARGIEFHTMDVLTAGTNTWLSLASMWASVACRES